MTPPTISIITPVLNGERFLLRAYQSLQAQTLHDWEWVICNDGSTDRTEQIIHHLMQSDSRIRLVTHATRQGLSSARNSAILQSRGAMIVYLDCDDEFEPDHLARVMTFEHQRGLIMFQYLQVEERVASSSFGKITKYDPGLHYQRMMQDNICVPLGVAHRRDLLDRVGLFDERLGHVQGKFEDVDLWQRTVRAGFPVTFVPHVCGRYYIRADSHARTAPMTMKQPHS